MSTLTPLTDPANFTLTEFTPETDAFNDPAWRKLVGLPESQTAAMHEFCRNPLHPGPCKGWKGVKAAPASTPTPEPAPVPKATGKRVKAAPAAAPAAKAAPSKRWPVSMTDVLEVGPGIDEDEVKLPKAVVSKIQKVFTVSHAGLTTANIKVVPTRTGRRARTVVGGDIVDADGEYVGHFARTLISADGHLRVDHTKLQLDPKVQGQGFAQALNKQLFDWYRQNGVEEVTLQANIDVGGYAWAVAGYDWANRSHAVIQDDIAKKLAGPADKRIPVRERAKQKRLAAEMSDRLENMDPADPNFPTPFEVSQLGRWPGAGKDDWWIGKTIMMGSDWDAVTKP